MTFTHALSTNNYGPCKFIVDASAANGTHTTIASAISSASVGDTIWIRQGTYTENLVVKKGITLASYSGQQNSSTGLGNVVIVGKMTFTGGGSGAICFNDIVFQTNSDYILETTANGIDPQFIFNNCYLNMVNGSGINGSSTGGGCVYRFNNCGGDLGTTGLRVFQMSTTSNAIFCIGCHFTNSGLSVTANTLTTTSAVLNNSYFENPFTITSASGTTSFNNMQIFTSGTNTTAFTSVTSGTTIFNKCNIASGSASAISVGASTTVNTYDCIINSSNTNTITGSGALVYSNLTFPGTNNGLNTTTQTYVSTTSKTTTFTGSTTWTKDTRTKSARIIGWGGGGGGGSGRSDSAGGVNRSGGGGGSCQGMFDFMCDSSVLGTTETVTIGAGGAGGTGVVSGNNGNNGTNGGVTAFGNINTYSGAVNSFGGGGDNTSATGGARPYVLTQGFGFQTTGLGGVSSSTVDGTVGEDTPNATAVGSSLGGGAGGGGGGRAAAVNLNGARGGNATTWAAAPSTLLAGGTAGAAGVSAGGNGNPASGVTSGGIFLTGTGGGGGGGGILAGTGGTGGIPGGGGGGSGGSATTTGNGGTGARGQILVIEYF